MFELNINFCMFVLHSLMSFASIDFQQTSFYLTNRKKNTYIHILKLLVKLFKLAL